MQGNLIWITNRVTDVQSLYKLFATHVWLSFVCCERVNVLLSVILTCSNSPMSQMGLAPGPCSSSSCSVQYHHRICRGPAPFVGEQDSTQLLRLDSLDAAPVLTMQLCCLQEPIKCATSRREPSIRCILHPGGTWQHSCQPPGLSGEWGLGMTVALCMYGDEWGWGSAQHPSADCVTIPAELHVHAPLMVCFMVI
jgi:hypothetical protein